MFAVGISLLTNISMAGTDHKQALRRAQYLLNASTPTDDQFAVGASSEGAYQASIRGLLDHSLFYDAMMRYHERLFGVGLPTEYLDELQRDDIDNKTNKFAQITCNRGNSNAPKFRCYWSSRDTSRTADCPTTWEEPVTVFWYPGMVAWVCPSVHRACGSDLSRCFIKYANQNEALNAELGTTEVFDSRHAVVKSLSKQSAGIASAVVTANYPYTKILEPGLTAVDGAIAHFYRQTHHFDLVKLNPPAELLAVVNEIPLTDTRFKLVNTGNTYEQAGILTTFGWLRRYEKNRTRANQLYERLLCRKFTSALPRVFPADPGNLRTKEGCSGCHATLDPLADFFAAWGEGGELYTGSKGVIATTFNGQQGSFLSQLADIIRNDNAFSTCQVENAWQWLIGRGFYRDEADLRQALSRYFVATNFSFKELVYAIVTHSAFTEGTRGDSVVGDPLEMPPLGQPPGGNTDQPCNTAISFATHITPNLGLCTNCHKPGTSRQDLSTEAQWKQWGRQGVSMMASGNRRFFCANWLTQKSDAISYS